MTTSRVSRRRQQREEGKEVWPVQPEGRSGRKEDSLRHGEGQADPEHGRESGDWA